MTTRDETIAQSAVDLAGAFVGPLRAELANVIVGQDRLITSLLVGLLTDGHILIEGVPGLAKTLTVKTLASALALTFSRIQFTPDLLPADVVGTLVYRPQTSEFVVHKGPVFANVVLADEINRAPAKVQSALLEAMQERHVTIGDTTYPLGDPFLVLATQNPIEHEGTHALPEAQLDRFLMRVLVEYPPRAEEIEVVGRGLSNHREAPSASITRAMLMGWKQAVGHVYVDPKIQGYAVDLVRSTRASQGTGDIAGLVRHGASPRAGVHLAVAARAFAFLAGRAYVVPEDVKAVATDVLAHRLLLTYDAEADHVSTRDVIARLLAAVRVP